MDGMALTEDIFFFARGAEFFRMPVAEIVRRKNHWMVQSEEFKTIENVLKTRGRSSARLLASGGPSV